MLIVLSDLHLSEAASTQIGSRRFNRNLPPETYLAYFAEINQFAKINQVNHVDLVLAGDILEISRSSIWLEGDERPYINNSDVTPGSITEETILKIIKAIAEEEKVAETLAIFRDSQNYFDMDVKLHLILGNHDRLANATQKIRDEVRKIFGISDNGDFIPHYLILEDSQGKPFCFIRHGHEYDPTNFSLNVSDMDSIPSNIPNDIYGKACLGDITTIEFGAALSWLFLKKYGGEVILNDETLLALYERLMEFDDVRPTTAWLAYLFSTPGIKKKKTWQLMKPFFTRIINTLIEHEEFHQTLKQAAAMSDLVRFILMAVLKSRLFRNGIPYWMIRMIMKRVSGSIKLQTQAKWAKREELILDKDSGCKCVISGHSHFAEVSLLSAKNGEERYYINTGTWRNVIPATKNYKDFGRLKALTKVIVFFPQEKTDSNNGRDWAFHYLSGVSYGDHRHL